jgi:hypothetical protein
MRPVVSAILCAWVTSAAGLAQAAEITAQGPLECSDVTDISFRVERSIGMPLAQAAPLTFDIVMERAASGYLAHLRASGEGGGAMQRELAAADCGELVEAVRIAVSLALGVREGGDGGTSAAHLESTGASAAQPAPAVAVLAPVADGAEPAPTPDDTALVPSLSLWLVADAGSLPTPGAGASLGAEVVWGKFQVRASGTLLFEQETQVEAVGSPAPGAQLDLITGALLGCTAPFAQLRGTLAPLLCVGAEVGRLAGIGTGVAAPRQGGALWAAPLVQAGGFWTIPGTSLRLGLLALAATPLKRDEFTLRGVGTVYRPPSLIGRLSVGFDVALR